MTEALIVLGAGLVVAFALLQRAKGDVRSTSSPTIVEVSKSQLPTAGRDRSTETIDEPLPTADRGFDHVFRAEAAKNRLDWVLLKAIAWVESRFNPLAENPADPSFGLMQLLCVPDGQGSCKNRLPAVRIWPPDSRDDLFNVQYNVAVAAQILAANLTNKGGDIEWAIAAYNSFRAFREGRDVNGQFHNQGYVDKVRDAYRRFGGRLLW